MKTVYRELDLPTFRAVTRAKLYIAIGSGNIVWEINWVP
jgi:hypothetical protein